MSTVASNLPGLDGDFDFERAVESIRAASLILAKPESAEAVKAIQDAAKAVAAVQQAVTVQDAP